MFLAKCGCEHKEDFGVEDNVNAERNPRLRLNGGTSLVNANGAGLHILLVEDDLDAAKRLVILLRCYGHRVQVALDGPSACQAALSKPPDVVLLDLAVPGMDGWEVARRLQEPTWEKKPFLIALTDCGTEADRPRCLESGIDLYLVKPVEPGFLRRVLERFRRVIMPTDAQPGEGTTGNYSGAGLYS
jgi:DNA-binding response OmpR family regulator